VCSRLKQPDEAKRHLERFQKLKDRQKETLRKADEKMMTDLDIFYENLATFFFDAAAFGRTQGTNPEVAEVLRKAFLLGQGSSVFLSRLAGYYSGADRATEALSLYLKAAQLAPKDASCPLNTGILLVRMGRAEKAEPFFRKAIELSPDRYVGYQELARLYLRMNSHLAEALQLATKAVELDARADTYYDLGAARLMNGDPNGAWTDVTKALELEPGNANTRQLLDVIRKKGGGK
jgi:tetratricopeptide (TPR) repeat protein